MRRLVVACALVAVLVAAGLTARALRARWRAIEKDRQTCFWRASEVVALSLLMYANDYGGRLPGPAWTTAASVYLPGQDKGYLVCPATPHLAVGYGMNEALLGRGLAELAEPWDVPMIFDSDNGPTKPFGGAEALAPASRHHGGVVVAMVDGHGRWYCAKPSKGQTGRALSDANRLLSGPPKWRTPPKGGVSR